ncbi:MAG TPA: hypothetical protein VMG31_04680 [Verrucomicrobiae bacterium]|nr:hypothetical protein [Verrucomicrobiae bacterium]
MADIPYNQNVVLARGRTDWGAIWAGVFIFTAIWSVFGVLGMAIFTGSANPAAQNFGSMNLGLGIWAVVLTMIAMFVAGRETARLASAINRQDGAMHGMIMFGLSVTAALVITVFGANSGTGIAETLRGPHVLNVLAGLGWIGFFSLFLGWLAAMIGASSGIHPTSTGLGSSRPAEPVDTTHRFKPAA